MRSGRSRRCRDAPRRRERFPDSANGRFLLRYGVKHEEFLHHHKERGDSWALFVLFQQNVLIAQQLNLIMSTQAQLAADLKLVLAEQQKTKAEIVFVQASVDTLTTKVAELQAIIDAGNTGEASQELADAVAAVKAAAQQIDDLIPDLPPPTTNAPVISSPLTASAQVGQPFNYQIVASGTPTSFDAAPLPDGLSVDTTTGVISGSPVNAGGATIGLTATNAAGVGQATLELTIAA